MAKACTACVQVSTNCSDEQKSGYNKSMQAMSDDRHAFCSHGLLAFGPVNAS